MRGTSVREHLQKAAIIWVTVAFTALTVTVLLPVGVQAAGQLVTLVDDNTSTQAQVITGGKLRVGDGSGGITVDGTVNGRETFGGRTTFTDWCSNSAAVGDSHLACSFDEVPAGKVLVVTHISARLQIPGDQVVSQASFDLIPTHSPGGDLWLAHSSDAILGDVRVFHFTQESHIPVRAGTAPSIKASRSASTGTAAFTATIAGYLLPA